MRDHYNNKRTIELLKSKIRTFGDNGKFAERYLDQLIIYGLSDGRVALLAWCTYVTLQMFSHCNIKIDDNITKSTAELIVRNVRQSDWSTNTRTEFLRNFKRFVSYIKQDKIIELKNGDEYSSEISWINPTKYPNKNKEKKLSSNDMISENELVSLVKAVTHLSIHIKRDQALLYTMYEFAGRPGEILNMLVGGLIFDHDRGFVKVQSTGKTGPKELLLILSYRSLLDWINEHPKADDPNAPLWYSKNAKDHIISYGYFYDLVKRAAKIANLKKSINPYRFRHSRLTDIAKHHPDQILKQVGNWSSMNMAERYVHLANSDVDQAFLRQYGLDSKDEKNEKLGVMRCTKCKKIQRPDVVRCFDCGTFLDATTTIKFNPEKVSNLNATKEKNLSKKVVKLESMILDQQKLIQRLINERKP